MSTNIRVIPNSVRRRFAPFHVDMAALHKAGYFDGGLSYIASMSAPQYKQLIEMAPVKIEYRMIPPYFASGLPDDVKYTSFKLRESASGDKILTIYRTIKCDAIKSPTNLDRCLHFDLTVEFNVTDGTYGHVTMETSRNQNYASDGFTAVKFVFCDGDVEVEEYFDKIAGSSIGRFFYGYYTDLMADRQNRLDRIIADSWAGVMTTIRLSCREVTAERTFNAMFEAVESSNQRTYPESIDPPVLDENVTSDDIALELMKVFRKALWHGIDPITALHHAGPVIAINGIDSPYNDPNKAREWEK